MHNRFWITPSPQWNGFCFRALFYLFAIAFVSVFAFWRLLGQFFIVSFFVQTRHRNEVTILSSFSLVITSCVYDVLTTKKKIWVGFETHMAFRRTTMCSSLAVLCGALRVPSWYLPISLYFELVYSRLSSLFVTLKLQFAVIVV